MSEPSALEQVATLVRDECGLELPANRPDALRAAIRRAGAEGADEFLALVGRPGSRAAVERLLDEVTVQETSLYRDAGQLVTIDWRGLYRAAAAGSGSAQLRVWSAGCATGEEAYTLAMLASEAFAPGLPPVEILGTDVSAAAIERAREGRYRPRRARAVPPDQLDRYLAADGHLLTVRPAVRALVRFQRHNLVRDGSPPAGEGPFDLVVCRNVLIYFEPTTAAAVVRALSSALRPGGLLLLGAADQLGWTVHGERRGGAGRKGAAPEIRPEPELLLARAVAAADAGEADAALAAIDLLLARDPLNAGGHFLRGLVELLRDPRTAVDSLRRALLIDPRFGLAAFQLGRAYDAVGDGAAARTAYEKALHTLDPDDARYDELLGQVDLGDVATAIRARIRALS